jgi:parallel beta-helix repeat protein
MNSTVAYQKLYFDSDSILRENTAVASSLYTEQIAFVASPLKESVNMGSVTFRFNNLLRFDNTGNPIVQLSVDFDDGNGMQQITNTLVTINYTSTNGTKTLRFEALLNSGDTLTVYATLYCTPPPPMNASQTSAHPYLGKFEDEKAIWAKIQPSNPYEGGTFSKARGHVWVYYANGDKKLRKPVLIVDGFDPTNDRTFEWHRTQDKGDKSIWKMLYYNDASGQEQHIGNQLLGKGYDLVVLDLPEGGIYIEQNAMVCIEVINWINSLLAENGSEEEIVVVGPSMGGQITRYALAYMEKNKNANTNYGNHNCRLWVSFDSPHQGANISIGAQAFIYYLGKEGDMKSVAKIWDNMLNCKAAQQMLMHHRSPWAYSIHNQYYNTSLRNIGYPKDLRKIAISNGSLNNTDNGTPHQITFEGVLPIVLYTLDLRVRNAVNYGEGEVFNAVHWALFVPISNQYVFNNTTGKCSPDAAPGSYYATFDKVADAAKGKLVVQTNRHTHCFMPVTSVLDISGNMNYCTDISNRDLVAEGKTPFNAYWGPVNKNMDHISFDNNLATWVLREIETYTQGAKTIELCEYQNYTVHLPSDVSSSTEVFWTCSENLIIVSGQGTKTITVKALAVEDNTWVQATVGSLTHSNLRTDASSLKQSKKQLKEYYIKVIPNRPCPSAPAKITENTIWTVPYQIIQPLTIENEATLTIQNTVYCAPLSQIIIEPGGRLIIDSGVLTNACDGELWQGIEVQGNMLMRQNETNQGVLVLNNARIENAVCGISAGKKGSSKSGGVVKAANAQFINNKQAVYFSPYIANDGNTYYNNASYFKNCSFVLNDNALFAEPSVAQVELQGVRGIFFQNSTFADARNIHSKKRLTNGIYANGASIRVGTSYWEGYRYPNGKFGVPDGCNFSGFDRAVYIQNSGIHQSRIYFSQFHANGIGIDCYSSNGLTVEGCQFYIPHYVYKGTSRLHGIWIESSSGFTVENNLITGAGGTGIHFKNNGVANHFVKSNTFANLCTGCVVDGGNGDSMYRKESQGLVFQCNSFKDNSQDIVIYKNSWMRYIQSGDNNRATGNIFSNSSWNISNSSDVYLFYYYYKPDVAHHVKNLYDKYSVTQLDSKDFVTCLSSGHADMNYYNVAIACPYDIDYLKVAYSQVKAFYQAVEKVSDENDFSQKPIDWKNPEVPAILEDLKDYNFDDHIHISEDGKITVKNTEINFPKDEPLAKQIFLYVHLTNLRQILDRLCYKALELLETGDEEKQGIDIEQYHTWVGRLSTIESKYLLVESYMEVGKYETAKTKLNAMQTCFEMPDGTLSPEYEDYLSYKNYFEVAQAYYQFRNKHGNDEVEIPAYIVDSLIKLSENDNLAGFKSSSLMERMNLKEIPYDDKWRKYSIHKNCMVQLILPKSMSGENPVLEEKISNIEAIQVNIYPNPANNSVHIVLDKLPETSVRYQLYDIQGRELRNGIFSGQQQELDISSLSKGLYFISVNIENQSRITKKIVKE